MKIVYLAARFDRREEMKHYRLDLNEKGIEVRARWIDTPPGSPSDVELTHVERRIAAIECIQDIDAADAVIVFTSERQSPGHNIEFGYALARVKRIYIVGQIRSVFHALTYPAYPDWEAFKAEHLTDQQIAENVRRHLSKDAAP